MFIDTTRLRLLWIALLDKECSVCWGMPGQCVGARYIHASSVVPEVGLAMYS